MISGGRDEGGQPERLGRGRSISVTGEGVVGGAAAVLSGRQGPESWGSAEQALTIPGDTCTLAHVAALLHTSVFRFPQASGTEESRRLRAAWVSTC